MKLLLLILAIDAGVDAPVADTWKEHRFGQDDVVCMTEGAAVKLAQHIDAVETEQKADEKALRAKDPAWLTVAIFAIAGLATGAVVTAGVCFGTKACR